MPEQSGSFGVGELDAVVRALSDAATGLNDQAGGAPGGPDAGEASADIARLRVGGGTEGGAGGPERARAAMRPSAGERKGVREKMERAREIPWGAGRGGSGARIGPPPPPPIPRLAATPAAATAEADKFAA